MHGRLKVKTTAEQDAEKQKERQKKLALYTAGSEKAREKRNQEQYDSEALSITGQLLQHNPDYYTVWNFRKEVLQFIVSEKSENAEEVQALLENELHLTEACLRKNPKSYGAWHHRSWTLKAMPQPNWKKELQTCNKYLQIDERNFHCWNHRRTVCGLANESPEEELAFTLKKIAENFSNYSAWHYRSSLLPRVHPGKSNFGPRVDQDILIKEYELVQNAAFTDPNDQSAWFYHRWLLGRAEFNQHLLCCHFNKMSSRVVVVFCKPAKKNITEKLNILVNGESLCAQWKCPEDELYASTVWYSDILSPLNEEADVEIVFDEGIETERLKCTPSVSTVWMEDFKENLYSFELSVATADVLQQELESCQQLLEMEPDNKWTLLTSVLLLRALNSLQHEPTILTYLETLVTVDSTRKNYYKDLRSKCVIENTLSTFLSSPQISLDLSKKNLSIFCHADHLVFLQTLDLSGNHLTSLCPLRNLVSLQELILDLNQVENCSGLEELKFLRTLSLNHNYIKNIDDLLAIKACESLQNLQIQDNPISNESMFVEKVKQLCPSLQHVN